eukprot:m.219946 g.219946  ORF g.219946 m.219946 type:complete len:691 (-) comp33307_c2_seq1:462-2534(-)
MMATTNVEEYVDPALVRTGSYVKAMDAGISGHHTFGGQMFTKPSILGTTKTFQVPLVRPEGESYGIDIATDDAKRHHVAKVYEGGFVSDILRPNDEIELINNKVADGLEHNALIAMLKDTTLDLVIRRVDEFYQDVVVEKNDNQDFGCHLGGVPMESDATLKKLFVSTVSEGSCAQGLLAAGDMIIAINQRLIGTLTHGAALDLISSSQKVRFTVQRSEITKSNVETTLEGQSAILEVKIQLKRADVDTPFGLNIALTTNSKYNVITGADSEAIHVGDEIVKVNGVSCLGKSHQEITDMVNVTTELDLVLNRHIKFGKDAKHELVPRSFTIPDPSAIPNLVPNNTFNITRETTDTPWGISFSTSNEFGAHVITGDTPSGPTKDTLCLHDEFIEIDGKECMPLSHDEVAQLLAGVAAEVKIFRHETDVNFNASVAERVHAARYALGKRGSIVSNLRPKITFVNMKVTLSRPSTQDSFGFSMGTDENGDAFVSDIPAGSLVEKILKTEDRILALDDVGLSGLQHDDVVDMFASKLSLKLTLQRTGVEDDETTDSHKVLHTYIKRRASVGKLSFEKSTVTINKSTSDGGGFGFGIGTLNNGDVLVTHVSENATGKLQAADLIFKVNDVDIKGKTHNEIISCITESDTVVLEIGREGGGKKLMRKDSITAARPGLTVADRTENNIGIETVVEEE